MWSIEKMAATAEHVLSSLRPTRPFRAARRGPCMRSRETYIIGILRFIAVLDSPPAAARLQRAIRRS